MGKKIHKKRWVIVLIVIGVLLASLSLLAYKYVYVDDVFNSSKTMLERVAKTIEKTNSLRDQNGIGDAVNILQEKANQTRYMQDAVNYLRYAALLSAKKGDMETALSLFRQANEKVPLKVETDEASLSDIYARINELSDLLKSGGFSEKSQYLREGGDLLYDLDIYIAAHEYYKQLTDLYSANPDIALPDDMQIVTDRLREIEALR